MPAFAHKSDDPIPINCGLKSSIITNPFDKNPRLTQWVTYAIAEKTLRDHFDVTKGDENMFGHLINKLPVEVIIETTDGKIQKSGYILILYDPKGDKAKVSNTDDPYNSSGAIFTQFPDLESYKQALKNNASCRLLK